MFDEKPGIWYKDDGTLYILEEFEDNSGRKHLRNKHIIEVKSWSSQYKAEKDQIVEKILTVLNGDKNP